MITESSDLLAATVDRKHAVLLELRELGRQQLELIAASDVGSLLRVLSAKQRLVERLQAIQRELDRFRSEKSGDRHWRRPEDRARCAGLLLRCESLIAEIIEQERRSEQELVRQRDDAAGRLSVLQSAAEAHGAYEDQRGAAAQLDVVSDR